MPFLIQRRRDNLYFRNTLQPAWTERSRFTTDVRMCRLFRTKLGARRARVLCPHGSQWDALYRILEVSS